MRTKRTAFLFILALVALFGLKAQAQEKPKYPRRFATAPTAPSTSATGW